VNGKTIIPHGGSAKKGRHIVGKKVLIVGQGGREHALAWKLAQSPEIEKLYAAPGNPGIAQMAECLSIKAEDIEGLLAFAQDNNIDLTVVGPEAPLMAGIVDRFRAAGLIIFGPTAGAAQLEGSKVFAKNLMKKYGIPTAKYEVFTEPEQAKAYARTFTDRGEAVVIKADGLAAGKGVIVAANYAEASAAIDSIMADRQFGEAGNQVVVEECLLGEEVSFFALTDGVDFVPLLSAQDHKRVFDNDAGPNTGGMGAYTNPPVFTAELYERAVEQVIKPVIKGMASEGYPYQGVLYAGLMITADGLKVLEFNARFGDPETQVLMPMIKSDLLPLLEASARGNIQRAGIELNDGVCVCVVLASGGYPGSYEKGKVIAGIDNVKDALVFQAGTALDQGRLITGGGRVLGVVCRGRDFRAAIDQVYGQVEQIHFEGRHYRRDIGHRALKK
jgi:phosphoribosylamine--glycine ligase